MDDWQERAETAEAQIERAMDMLGHIKGETLEERVAQLLSLFRAAEVEILELQHAARRTR
jgi:hypothetical protein